MQAMQRFRSVLKQSIRLYHDSRFTERRKAPLVRVANTRIQRTINERKKSEASVAVQDADPRRTFEPFPYAVTEENKAELVKKVTMPLYNVPYKEQLSAKESFCRNALRLLGQDLYKMGTAVRLDVRRLPCHVNPIVPCKKLYGYRNKDELSIWRGHDGQVTAGYMVFPIGKHGDSVCVEPDASETSREVSHKVSRLLQTFLREKAQLPVSYSLGYDGGWRRFSIRYNSRDEVMLIGFLSPRGLRVQQVINERDNFRDYFVAECEANDIALKSLYYQPCPHNKCSHKTVPYELLHGDPTISEQIGKFTFNVSPDSFLHQNVEGAELFYDEAKKVIDQCYTFKERNIKPLVIDLKCGAGALAINLADMASHVVGIDNDDLSVDDARQNAQLNGISNAEFICSEPEIVLERLLEKYSRSRNEILVVCDVPRSGLHRNVIDVVRHCPQINKMLYITSKIDHQKISKNLIDLCKKGDAPPFVPVMATPVDVYPNVEVFQTILALERVPNK